MTKLEWGLVIVAVILVGVAVNSYMHMGDSLATPNGVSTAAPYKATLGYNPNGSLFNFGFSGGFKV